MADRLTIEHYVGEAFVKCGQVILGSRILSTVSVQQQPRSAQDKRAGRWFHMELQDMDGVGKEVELWRKDISSPLVIDMQVAQGGMTASAAAAPAAAAFTTDTGDKLGARESTANPSSVVAVVSGELGYGPLERWTLQYERSPPPGSGSNMAGAGGSGSNNSGTRTYLDDVSVYKRLILLVRSLYSYTRLLPAYKLFRAAKRCPGDHLPVQLQYRIHRTLQQQALGAGATALPLPAAAAPSPPQRLQEFTFAPVDTPGGRFRVAVQYNPAAAALVLAHSTVPVAMPYTLNEDYLGPGGAAATEVARSLPRSLGPGPYPAPGTSGPAFARGPIRHTNPWPAMSASVSGTAVLGRSPPVGTAGAQDGALRHAPSAGSGGWSALSPGSAAVAAAAASSASTSAAPSRVIVRQSWSSKEIKVSFSLPPPLGSPGSLGIGGGGAGTTFRRSSSGYGSTSSTPTLPSPDRVGRPGAPPVGSIVSGVRVASGAAETAGVGINSHHRPPSHHPSHSQQSPPTPLNHQYGRSEGAVSHLGSTPPRNSGNVAAAAAAAAASGGSGDATPVRPCLEPDPSASAALPMSASAASPLQHQVAYGGGGTGSGTRPQGRAAEQCKDVFLMAAGTCASRGSGTEGIAIAHAGPEAAAPVAAGGAGAHAHGTAANLTAPGNAASNTEAGTSRNIATVAAVPAAAATLEGGSGATSRVTSTPLAIPVRSSSRTRSVVDLRAPAVYGGFEVHPAVAAAATSSLTAASAAAAAAAAGLLIAQDVPADVDSTAAGACAAAAPPQHRMAPGSAPAAPRGMLGLALGALKPISTGSGLGGTISKTHNDSAATANRSGDAGPSAAGTAASAAESNDRAASGGSSTGLAVVGVVTRAAATASAVAAAAAPAVSPRASRPATAGSQALAALSPCFSYHHQLSHQLRHASLPYSGGPGSSPPSGRALPVPAGSLLPYGSPTLPFAFTPSVPSMSLASLHQAMVPLGYFGGGGGQLAFHGGTPRAVSGRDITSLATIRRPSWSSRSGSLDPSVASAGAAGVLMPLLSPNLDLLESSYSNASTPGAPHPHAGGRPDSGDQSSRRTDLCCNPSSSSTSAIFSLSPGFGRPSGNSPPLRLHPSKRHNTLPTSQQQYTRQRQQPSRASGQEAIATGMEEEIERVREASGRTASRKQTADGDADGGGVAAAAATLSPKGGSAEGTSAGAGRDDSMGAAGDVEGGSGDLTEQLSVEPEAVPFDLMYGPYGDYDSSDPHLCQFAHEDSESDLLPFALDQEGLVLSPVGTRPVGADRAGPAGSSARAGPLELTLSIAQVRERDVTVGAFVRMMADAQPLAAPPHHPAAVELTPQQALAELEQLATRIRVALDTAAPQLAAAAAATSQQQHRSLAATTQQQQQHWGGFLGTQQLLGFQPLSLNPLSHGPPHGRS